MARCADSKSPALFPLPDDPCTIIYSSGTTGEPKGIVHTHEGRPACSGLRARAMMHEDGIAICSLGLFQRHVAHVQQCSSDRRHGRRTRFEPESFLRIIEKTAATHLFLVPLQYQMLVECPARASCDATSLQVLLAAGATMTEALKKRVSEWVRCAFVEAYGLTEGFATILSDQDGRRKPTSVGRPIHGADLRILRDDDTEAAVGEPGEIVGLARVIMQSYFNRPAETEAMFWTDELGRRWLRSGDIGYLDDEGFLYLLDRKKDMINSGGQNVYPVDIEAAAAQHPDVAQVAVIGLAHVKWGETPVAIVVPRANATTTDRELMAWINERVGKRQRISAVHFDTALPRNALGKVLKRELRARFAGASLVTDAQVSGER